MIHVKTAALAGHGSSFESQCIQGKCRWISVTSKLTWTGHGQLGLHSETHCVCEFVCVCFKALVGVDEMAQWINVLAGQA